MKPLILENKNVSNSITISTTFLDKYMPEANGEFVKIYLYLIRCMSDQTISISISLLADKFNHTENDVLRALKYWEKVGLISLNYDSSHRELMGISILSPESSELSATSETISEVTRKQISKIDIPEKKSNPLYYNTSQSNDFALKSGLQYPVHEDSEPIIIESIADRLPKPSYTSTQLKQFTEKEDLRQLIYITEKYLGKTLTSTDINTIIYFYETLKFPSDLVEYLIEYCVSKEHKSMRYIEKVALSWADTGIKNVSQAKKEAILHTNNTFSVMKAFGISNRNPGLREQEYINKWNDVYCFDSEIIIEACNRTLQATHQPSFEYADSILTKWKEKNVSRLSELKELDEQHALSKSSKDRLETIKSASKPKNNSSSNNNNKFNNFPQRDYDFDELEKQLIGNNK